MLDFLGRASIFRTTREKTALLPRHRFQHAVRRGRLFFLYRGQTKSVKLLPRLLFSMFNSYSATLFGVYLDLVSFLLTALLPRHRFQHAVRRGRLFFLYRGQRHKLRFGIVLSNYCLVARLLLSHKIKDFAGDPIKALPRLLFSVLSNYCFATC